MKLATRTLFLSFAFSLLSLSAFAQTNSTLGYGDGELLRFIYTQNFDCIDQPKDDLNFNGVPAALDPGEKQIPICQVGTNPTINPPGKSATRNSPPSRSMSWSPCSPLTATRTPMTPSPATTLSPDHLRTGIRVRP